MKMRMRILKLLAFGFLLITVCGSEVSAQTKPASRQTGPATGRPTETMPAAHYDIGAIIKRLSGLEAQVADLEKRNDALETQVKKMQVQIGSLNTKLASSGKEVGQNVDPIKAELQRLDNALRNHTHSLNIGVMALSAIPGMQDMANKAGVGNVIQQWQTMKMLWTTGGGPGQTGTATIP